MEDFYTDFLTPLWLKEAIEGSLFPDATPKGFVSTPGIEEGSFSFYANVAIANWNDGFNGIIYH